MSDHKTQLALVREQRLAALRGQLGVRERMTLRFACAERDIDYTVVLSRASASERFTCETIEPAAANATGGLVSRLFTMPQKPLNVPASAVSFAGIRCAGCGRSGGWTRCSACGAFVCDAHAHGNHFRCRASCGASFQTKTLTDVSGARPAPASRPALEQATARKSLPKRTRISP